MSSKRQVGTAAAPGKEANAVMDKLKSLYFDKIRVRSCLCSHMCNTASIALAIITRNSRSPASHLRAITVVAAAAAAGGGVQLWRVLQPQLEDQRL